ncbi:LOW QUALITY PROTEIN: phosphoinositide 3-kinase adapter protein 1 [Sceloporus undulatus]|uniref:LOW QUALITY PROTEIN: phosphoinositide 3-kinase adapter protein 1 n=1 Tax=Sceloporus undulatus TaxID=8520 RepID=UPI001C4B8309|nr:LOW QUALITY PROTEIN: phosphoinositide 3-kinase adapter protein 1 [Sceloporus undulatus]
MAAGAAPEERPDACDVLIVYGKDASDWCQYLQSLFHSCQEVQSYQVETGTAISMEDLDFFNRSKCIIILLSSELVQNFYIPAVLQSLQNVLQPPHKVVKLFCDVSECETCKEFFEDWSQWKQLTYDDDSDVYIAAVMKAISEGDSGCDSVTDAEVEDDRDLHNSCNITTNRQHRTRLGSLVAVQPDRIRCGVQTTVYMILKCKLDSQVKMEVEFSSDSHQPVRVQAKMENEYTVSVCTPQLPPGTACLRLFSGDLMIVEASVSYYTDMEEISNLLAAVANPVEFMCQAFKIVPYNTEALDKILTESLKKNLPACGLHLLGINQLEEENITSQRDEELPTLLHFSAKYGLKNLTALLLTCPGALQAYSVANKHGWYPNNLAEKHGFKDLRQFIDEYVETADMLKSHIKEELMQGKEDGSVYESMAHLSTDLLMKCSLNPGCDEELYESMAGTFPSATEDLYVEMLQSDANNSFSQTPKDYMMRKFLEGVSADVPEPKEDIYHKCEDEDVYHKVEQDSFPQELVNRPPVPVPRPDPSLKQQDKQSYIYKVFADKNQLRPGNLYVSGGTMRNTAADTSSNQSLASIYDPFAGMKTPGQRQLITLQEQVKLGMLTVDEAVLCFKEWQLNQKRRSESFRFQQENLQRLRESITRRQIAKQKAGKPGDLDITVPVGPSQNIPKKPECSIYEFSPRKNFIPPSKEIKRGDWKTESTSSTASSSSNRSSTRSVLSISSGMDGDNEDNEMPEVKRNFRHGTQPVERPPTLPPGRPPRIPPRVASRAPSSDSFHAPPVPPRGREMPR